MKIRMRCAACDSTDVLLDAWASWDEEAQEWVLDRTFDEAFCNSCEGSCSINEEPL